MKRKRKLPPKPKEPPEGWMLYYRRVVRVEDVEATSKEMIGDHDNQPRFARDRANYPERFRK